MYNRYGCEVLCLTTQFESFCWKVPVIFKVFNSLAKTKCHVQLHRFLSPFLRNSAWTSSRHHPRKGGIYEDYRLSLAKTKIWGCMCALWFVPDLFPPSSPLDLTSKKDCKTCGIVAQYKYITCRTDLERKPLLHIPKTLQETRTQHRATPNCQVNTTWKCHLSIKKVGWFVY